MRKEDKKEKIIKIVKKNRVDLDGKIHDNPFLRHEATTSDLLAPVSSDQPSNFRLAAVKYTDKMLSSEANRNHWIQLGPTAIPFGQAESSSRVLVTGRVTAIVVDRGDPSVIYAGTAQGGIWKTTDSGRNWSATSDQARSLAIGALAIDPNNHNILYAGTGEGNLIFENTYYGCGVLKTTDGGKKWELKGGGDKGPFNGARFFRTAVNPLKTTIIFAATSFGLYRSSNEGEEWKKMTNGLPEISNSIRAVTDIVINPDDPDVAYAAFWGSGIYKTQKSGDDTVVWHHLTSGLPSNGFTRIALAISQTSPNIVYALMANDDYIIDKFYMTTDDGLSWQAINLPDTEIYGDVNEKSMGGQGWYNLNITVDPTTPDVVYLSGMTILKAVRNPTTNKWGFTDIGKNIHTDHHAFAFHSSDNFVIYDGSDGGIYRSNDGGITWNDVINEGLCIAQFEFIDQHPNSDAVIIAGTQDNGTIQFRNNSAFYHSADGDGGYVAVDQRQPNIIFHEYYNPTPERSEQGGKFGEIENGGSWEDISSGLGGNSSRGTSLFYPPFALDRANSKNIAFGTYRIFLDDNQGKNGWTVESPPLPNLLWWELVSAINYVNSNLIYVGTTAGKVFCLNKKGSEWTAKEIDNGDLPSLYIWDIATLPQHENILVIVMGAPLVDKKSHIWRGEIRPTGLPVWIDISGVGRGRLPDIPINAIVIEPKKSETMYIGTDVGVFYTADSGHTWKKFGAGLPNCAVHDLCLQNTTRILRAATFGRGIWEIKVDVQTTPKVDLYVRDHLLDTGRFSPSASGVIVPFEDPLQNVMLGDKLSWWMCSDIKVDPPFYQIDIQEVDYVKFEYRLRQRNLQRGRINRIYVQVHNRGTQSANDVVIKIFYNGALKSKNRSPQTPVFPGLSVDFWKNFYSDTIRSTGPWAQIGETKKLPCGPKTLTNTEPTVLAWEWNVPLNVPDRIGLLVIVDSSDDPIPDKNKTLSDNIEKIVRNEKHVGLKLITVEDAPY